MKKKMILAGMALLAMTACSKDKAVQVNPGESIAFRTSVPNATRATATTTQSLSKFHVWGIYDGGVMLNLDVEKNGSSWNTNQPWAGKTWDFYAIAPETVASSVTLTATNKKYENFTPADAADQQIDLIAAQATGKTEANSASGVALNFKHLLSQIEIKAKSSDTEKMKVEVIGVRVNSVKSTSTFTFPADLGNASTKESWWSTPATEKSFFIKGTAPVTLTGDAQSLMFDKGNFMLVPYQLVAWNLASDKTNAQKGSYLSILCRVSQKAADGSWKQVYPATEGKYNFSAVPISTKWVPGKKYVYTLNMFGPKGNGGGNQDPDPTVPTPDPDVDPTPGVEPGNPILGGTISFTVEVEDWVDAPAEDIDM